MKDIKSVKHVLNEKVEKEDGSEVLNRVDRIEYVFADSVSEEAIEAVESHQPPLKNKQKIQDIINSVDG